jgi:signal transduction histidine kinase/CheY-like chemotaxis protein
VQLPIAQPPSPIARWLALGAAGGAALAVALEMVGLDGPWQSVALLLTLLALFAISAFVFSTRRREQAWRQADERATRGEAEMGALQRELDRHTQLEQQLLKAKQEAESAVLAKGEFLATMSHEIRTPLNGIVPMLDLLMQARLSADHGELVRTAFTSSQQLLRIVDGILDYSKLEADRLELESTPFNLRELLETVIQLMERPAEAKGLRLHLNIDPSVRLLVRGDPVRLRQVLGNLISNAVKFTERGMVTLTVRRIGESVAQHQLKFEVRDTGIGIAAEAQPRLFQAFTQADASTTRLYGGTGLGLAICKRIIELMGGRIDVQSEPGRGSTFSFEVPLLKVQGDMPTRELEFAGERLLLLSADARLRLRLSMLLPNWGLRVTAVETTQDALDRLRAAAAQGAPWAYGIVLADLVGMRNTALALHRNLERHAVYGDVRLVCLHGDDAVPEELRRNTMLLSRQVPDADLRAALTSKPPPRNEVAPASDEVDAAAPGLLRNARVLLVEDNPVNLMVGQRLLGVLGVDCDTASNGEAALLRMSASRYDVVLMDCQMPVMDGYTATRRWRAGEQAAGGGNHVPIVAMTANAMAGDRQKCIDAGMDDYLAKPVTRAELERCLHRWWRPQANPGSRAAPAAESLPQPPPPAAIVPAPEPETLSQQQAAQDHDTGPAIDSDVIEELRLALGGEVEQLINVFLDDTPMLIARLEAAALAPDMDMLREVAHSLKSSSANLGAMALSVAAKRVELGVRTGTLDRPAVAVAMVSSEFARASQALRALNASIARAEPAV